MERAFGILSPAGSAQRRRGVSVNLRGGARRLLREGEFSWWRLALAIAFVILLLCLTLWALSPRGFFSASDQPGEWEYHPPAPAPPPPPAAFADKEVAPDLDASGPLPDTGDTGTPDLRTTPREKPSAALRVPLVKPVPDNARAGVAPHRRRRHLLGLSKLWHWIRPGRTRTAEDSRSGRLICNQRCYLLAVRRAESGARVPPHDGFVTAVGTGRDVVEIRFSAGIERRIEKAGFAAGMLVHQRHERGPQRRDRAGAADDCGLSVDENLVAGCGRGIAGNIRHTAAALAVGGSRNVGPGLP